MCPAGCRTFSALDEPLRSVLPNGFQHKETRVAGGALSLLQKTLIHEGGDSLQNVEFEIAVSIAHRLGALQRESSSKYRQSSEQLLLGGIQQTIAPVDTIA